MAQVKDHEIVSIYPFSEAQIDKLMTLAPECVLNWSTKDGWPMGVVHSFVWDKGHVWLTFAAHRHRAAAIKRDPRVTVIVSGATSRDPDCPRGQAAMKGTAVFHDDKDTKEAFYHKLSKKVSPTNKAGEDDFYDLLDSPLRTVVEITPVKWITYDGAKAGRHMRGEIDESELGPMLSVDAVRMQKLRAERGMAPRTKV